MITICEKCGQPLSIREWPFCPHGFAQRTHGVASDRLEQVFENLGHEPVYCDTKADLQREMDARNLRLRDTWVPGDTQLTNCAAYIDAKTLDDKRVLLSRPAERRQSSVVCETFRASIREVKLHVD